MKQEMSIAIHSEVGELEGVILHAPGPEVENMIPGNAKRALYSDLLNLVVLNDEYTQFAKFLGRVTRVFTVKELLNDILNQESVKTDLISTICVREKAEEILPRLLDLAPDELSRLLIEGVEMEKDNLTKYLDKERYTLQPLHNFFYMRDPVTPIFDQVMVNSMANSIRERESFIMEAILARHPIFKADVFHPVQKRTYGSKVAIEGGDILVAREDILIVGQGGRTNTQGIDSLIEFLKARDGVWNIIVQELPYQPESFIHLDMVFTLLDVDTCMVYKPLILDSNRYLTIHIQIDHGKVKIREGRNVPSILDTLGMPMETICCGGTKDSYLQEREQWHSGANFFCLSPGKAIGYSRNVFTMEEMDRRGFTIVPIEDLQNKPLDLKTYRKVVFTIDGTELARGGGGCRCMTLPVRRKRVDGSRSA